jgi:Uncharacterized protein conserved in bacteria (DUF2169)
MKLVKPSALSFTCRPLLLLGRQRLTLTSLIGFSLSAGAPRLIPEIVLWPAIAAVTGGLVDEGLPKPRGEVLVYGSCHTPGAKPLPACHVRVQLGAVDKKLAVIGDRCWQEKAWKDPSTQPVPFTEMPIGWDRAFGGPDYAKNPLGRGIVSTDGVVALPNIEHAGGLITSPSQRPDPAGFGPLDVAWPQRTGLAGTYDARWLKEGFPGFARDTDPAFFSTAPAGQRIEGFFRGDEAFVLENLHPTRPRVAGVLPSVAARAFVRTWKRDFEAVTMRLDSVVFLPGKEIGLLVFRGTVDVEEDDAADVTHVLAACEELGAPRDLAHYKKALESRLDKDQSPLLALQEDDLLPGFAKVTEHERTEYGAVFDAATDSAAKPHRLAVEADAGKMERLATTASGPKGVEGALKALLDAVKRSARVPQAPPKDATEKQVQAWQKNRDDAKTALDHVEELLTKVGETLSELEAT